MNVNEKNFVSLIRHGHEEGILYVIEEYGGLLQSIVRSRLPEMPDRVEECMNDILLGIWKNIGSFDEKKGTFKNWAAGIARLEAIDSLRKMRRECLAVSLEEMEIPREDEALLELAEQGLSEETEALLSCLSPKDRELFRRLYMDEEDVKKAGQALGISKENVYVRVFRGKKKIRRQAEQKGVKA